MQVVGNELLFGVLFFGRAQVPVLIHEGVRESLLAQFAGVSYVVLLTDPLLLGIDLFLLRGALFGSLFFGLVFLGVGEEDFDVLNVVRTLDALSMRLALDLNLYSLPLLSDDFLVELEETLLFLAEILCHHFRLLRLLEIVFQFLRTTPLPSNQVENIDVLFIEPIYPFGQSNLAFV